MSVIKESSTKETKYYTEKYRPQFHFTPEENWMNDPNGMVYYDGEYHLFYQYHPGGLKWGPMHWGHAVSKDMLRWEHLSTALEPDDLGMIFSGSIVVDWNDTTGFFNGEEGLVALFTHCKNELQSQSIAYSKDKGRSWIKYSNNPVIPNVGIKDFRDPKVFWHDETNKWVMVLAAGQKVMFYGSSNLLEWAYLSEFSEGAHGGVWECPDLFQLPVNGDCNNMKWVLQVDLGDGAVAGGSGGQYFIGEFDGTTFKNDHAPSDVLWLDYGKDFYAAQSFSDIPKEDGRRIWMAWMSNWKYANELPTNPWRSTMSIPREVELKQIENGDVKLFQRPITELNSLRKKRLDIKNKFVNSEMNILAGQNENVFEIVAEIENLTATEFGFKVRKSSADEEETIVGYDLINELLFVNRENARDDEFSDQFKGRHSVQITNNKESVKLHLLIDKSSIEVFFNDGEAVITDLIFPEDQSKEMEFYIVNGEVNIVSLELYALQSTWS